MPEAVITRRTDLLTLARRGIAALFALFWVGGVVSYVALGGPPAGSEFAAPLFLALAAAVVLAWLPLSHWRWPLTAALVGFTSELAGVAWGVPFGGYQYTDVLAPTLLGVPLVLTCAWLILVVHVQAHLPALGRTTRTALGAVWMTAIDLLIDPLAAGPLDYWRWHEAGPWYGIPLSNFAGWLLVSAVIFALMPAGWRPTRGARLVGASVILFFAIIAFAAGLWLPGLIGLALLAPEAARARKAGP